MTEEDMLREGRTAGVPFFDIYDWTWGEVTEYILCKREADRRHNQDLSVIAFHEAESICLMLLGKKVTLYKEFPYWTEEEIQAIEDAMVERHDEDMYRILMANSINGGNN